MVSHLGWPLSKYSVLSEPQILHGDTRNLWTNVPTLIGRSNGDNSRALPLPNFGGCSDPELVSGTFLQPHCLMNLTLSTQDSFVRPFLKQVLQYHFIIYGAYWNNYSLTDDHTRTCNNRLTENSYKRQLHIQHTTNTRDGQPCPEWHLNPQFQQLSSFRPAPLIAWPPGLAPGVLTIIYCYYG